MTSTIGKLNIKLLIEAKTDKLKKLNIALKMKKNLNSKDKSRIWSLDFQLKDNSSKLN